VIRTRLGLPAAVLGASLALLASGCSTGTSSGQTQTGGIPTLTKVANLEKTTLNVAAVPAMDSAGFFIALHDGLFKQEGLTVNYSPATSSETAIGAQEKGTYDITAGNYVSYIEASALHGAQLQIIAEGSVMLQGAQVVLTMPKSHINTLSELRGHTVAVNAAGNIDFLLTASALNEHGIPVNSGNGLSGSAVNFNSGVPFPFMAQALTSGQYQGKAVNAVTVPEPFASQMEQQQGAITIADLNQGATTQFPIEGYVVTKSWARANPNTLKAFLTALEAGQQIADTNRPAVEAAFESLAQPQTGKVSPVIASMMALDNYPLGVDKTRLQRVANVMQQFGVLPKAFNIQNMLG
jgi:NitT/TauT family transport system substrate-binding protein